MVGALALGAAIGAYLAGDHYGICVDRATGDGYCTAGVHLSGTGGVGGAVLAGGAAYLATCRGPRGPVAVRCLPWVRQQGAIRVPHPPSSLAR